MHRGVAGKRVLEDGTEMHDFEGAANKRQQMGDGVEPSRVLLLSNIPQGVTEIDICSLVHRFTRGCTPKVYMHASCGRAFVEFVDIEASTSALEFLKTHQTQLKGSVVHAMYSKRDAVTTMEEKVEPFKVVLASVTNLIHSVDLDLLHHLFSKHGKVEKIVAFSKTPTVCQALIQFQNPENAREAWMMLHNRNIYDGCNTLQIRPSKLQELVVKCNCHTSWDYTTGDVGPPANRGPIFSSANGGPAAAGVLPTPTNGMVGIPYGQPPPSYNPRDPMGGGMGGQFQVTGGYGMQSPPPVFGGGDGHINMMLLLNKLPRELRELKLETTNRNQTPVLICYNLPDLENPAEMLFNIFSLFGTVMKIKMMREKEGSALIQYSCPLYATIAYHFLQHSTLLNKEIQVNFSKNYDIKMPRALDEEDSESCKKAKNFALKDQRYGQGDDTEKYVRSACKPTNTLFIANIHDSSTEAELMKAFQSHGTVTKFQFKPPKEGSKSKMAVLEMGSEVEALTALMNLHNSCLNSRAMKVAFSKTVIT